MDMDTGCFKIQPPTLKYVELKSHNNKMGRILDIRNMAGAVP